MPLGSIFQTHKSHVYQSFFGSVQRSYFCLCFRFSPSPGVFPPCVQSSSWQFCFWFQRRAQDTGFPCAPSGQQVLFAQVIGSELSQWPSRSSQIQKDLCWGSRGRKHFFCWRFRKEDDKYLELPRKPALCKAEPRNRQKLGRHNTGSDST